LVVVLSGLPPWFFLTTTYILKSVKKHNKASPGVHKLLGQVLIAVDGPILAVYVPRISFPP